jgi:transcriptional regulator with XRE-family HTH domain
MANNKRGYKAVLQVSSEEMKEYGEFFKSMRESIGLTKPQMAEEIGVFFTTIHRWEKGERIPKQDIDGLVERYRKVVKEHKAY